jgi:tetratricopeptide (TPR) repeat protein
MDDGAGLAAPRDEPVMSAKAPDPFWDEVRELFQAAAELPSEKRAELLQRGDARVRAEVESLLAAHDESGAFLEKSVWDYIDAAEGDRLAGAMIGPYRVVRPLGHGGMGTIFLAVRGDEFAQRVAIKLVRGGSGAGFVQRFRQERQILAALEHPNIARLLDGGTSADGLPFLAMELVDGVPIDEYCRTHTLSVAQRQRLFLQLCDAVQYAHRNLVIHRDIKPANVLVTAEGVPKLLDFGIAKLVSPDTRPDATVTRLMTPEYASPEQLLGELVTTATDVYSLGVLLYELLTGAKPFTAHRAPRDEAPRPSAQSRALKGDLDNIVAMAMEVNPARRYGSVEQLADDVRRHLSGHPIAARRPTFRYRASKFVRRNKLGVAAGAAIVAVTAIAFAATLHQKKIAERRFEQVRSLAHSVVFEIHDAIATLPGSTPARELLVRRALVYLDNLSAEAEDNNTPLQIELAGAYVKIGDVQGLPYRPNLGDTAGALARFRKALAIAQGVHEDEPDNREAIALLADAHDRIGFVEQRTLRWVAALTAHETSRQLRERLAPHRPQDALALARTWVAIGDDRYIGDRQIPPSLRQGSPREAYETALRILETLPRQGPHRSELLMETGRAHQHLGGLFTGVRYHDMNAALRHHEAALRALEERSRLAPSDAVARRNVADQLVMRATAQNRIKDGAGALDGTARALVILKELAASDPKNIEAQHDLAFAYEQLGIACMHLQRWDEAERATRDAIAIRDRLVAADAGNREDRRGLSVLYSSLSAIREGRGDRDGAERYKAKAAEIFDALSR